MVKITFKHSNTLQPLFITYIIVLSPYLEANSESHCCQDGPRKLSFAHFPSLTIKSFLSSAICEVLKTLYSISKIAKFWQISMFPYKPTDNRTTLSILWNGPILSWPLSSSHNGGRQINSLHESHRLLYLWRYVPARGCRISELS